MRRKTLLYLIPVLILAAAIGYQFIGHDVPAGQQPLADLDGESLESFRQQFNSTSDSAVDEILRQHAKTAVQVFAVWQPMIWTDWSRPTSSALKRLSDTRVTQFWDKGHVLAKRMAQDARDPQPKPNCCEQDGILWDLVSVYPPGTLWAEKLPTAILFDGPVVRLQGDVAKALAGNQ